MTIFEENYAATPFADMGGLAKFGLALQSINDPNIVARHNQGAYAEQDRIRGLKKDAALKALSDRMQAGELDQAQAHQQYAGITGDYSGLFGTNSRAPAALQIYAAVKDMSPEEQDLFFRTQRGQQTLNLGGTQAVLNPLGGIAEQYPKTLAPENLPKVRAAQTRAIEAEKGAAALSQAADKKAVDAKSVMGLLGDVDQYLDKASGSYPAAAGAFGKARILGMSDEQTQADASLRVIGASLVAKMPRMEGPQSDRDVQMYKEAAGELANPSVPAKDKKAAIEVIKTINEQYGNDPTGGYAAPAAAPAAKPVTKLTDDELLAIIQGR